MIGSLDKINKTHRQTDTAIVRYACICMCLWECTCSHKRPQSVKFPYFKKPFTCQPVTLGEQWTVSFYEQQVTVNKRRERGGWEKGVVTSVVEACSGVRRARLSGASECWCTELNKLLTAVKSAAEEVRSNMGRRRWEERGGQAHWDTQEVDSAIYTCISYLTHCSYLSLSSLRFFPLPFFYRPHSFSSPPDHFLIHSLYSLTSSVLHVTAVFLSAHMSSALLLFCRRFLTFYCPPAFLWTSEVNIRLVLWSSVWYIVPDPRATG